MTDREQLGEIEAYYKIVGNIVEAEWIWLIDTLKKYMDENNVLIDMQYNI